VNVEFGGAKLKGTSLDMCAQIFYITNNGKNKTNIVIFQEVEGYR
jgi:hypothetical protein